MPAVSAGEDRGHGPGLARPLHLELRHWGVVGFSSPSIFRGHAHPGYEWVLCLEGELAVETGGRVLHLCQGDFLLLDGRTFHFYWPMAGETLYFTATFTGHSDWFESRALMGGISRLPPGWGQDVFRRNDLAPEEVLLECLRLILSGNRKQGRRGDGRGKGGPVLRSLEGQILAALGLLLEREPGVAHQLGDLCRHFQMSRTQLTAKVKEATGHSLMELYHREKIQRVVPLLREGLTLAECAERMGYANPFHLSRKFKEVMGEAPSRWRLDSGKVAPAPHEPGRVDKGTRGKSSPWK